MNMQFANPPSQTPHPPTHLPPPSVPPGWTTQFDQNYQTWFFVNLQTHQSQWEPPTGTTLPPHVNAPSQQETDEKIARRLQAEFERAEARPDSQYGGSSPYPQSHGAYGHSSAGEYNSSFAAGEPWGQTTPSQPPPPQQQSGKDSFSKIFDKYSHKFPMASTIGAAADLKPTAANGAHAHGAHSAPNSRPGSPSGGQIYSAHHKPSYADSNGHLALPGHDQQQQSAEDKKKKRSSWAAGAAGTYALTSEGAGKVKNMVLYGSSSGGGWDGGKTDKKKKKDRKSWGGGGGKDWGGLGGGGGGDGGDGGGDDGSGIGEVLGALLG